MLTPKFLSANGAKRQRPSGLLLSLFSTFMFSFAYKIYMLEVEINKWVCGQITKFFTITNIA